MKMSDLIRAAETRLRSAESDHKATRESLTDLRARVEDGYAPTEGEVSGAIQVHEAATDRRDAVRAELANLRAELANDLEVERMQHEFVDVPDPRTKRGNTMSTGKTYVVSEPSQYTEHAEREGGPSFLRDLFASQIKSDPQAGERLSRHGREVESTMNLRVGTTTTTVASFVPPAYVTDLFAEFARRGRPMVNLLTSYPLPASGMTITVPRVTTPSQVTTQSTENSPIQDTAMAATPLVLDVITCGGYVPVSRQALERGELVEAMVFNDLAGAYAEQLDQLVIAEALGQANTNSITYTSSSPTVVELWPKFADAVGRVRSLRYAGPSAVVMTPQRWAWCLSELSSSDDRPLFPVSASSPVNAMGTQSSTEYDQAVGQVLGLPVYLDGNIPTNSGTGTNEDTIFVLDGRDAVIFEDPSKSPSQLKFEAAGGSTLSINLVAYGYSAFSFGRHPASLSKITGTGLAAPGAL